MGQLHKNFTTDQVKNLLERYLSKEVERKYIEATLGIKKRRFFILLKQYRNNPDNFSVEYRRNQKHIPLIQKLKEISLKS